MPDGCVTPVHGSADPLDVADSLPTTAGKIGWEVESADGGIPDEFV